MERGAYISRLESSHGLTLDDFTVSESSWYEHILRVGVSIDSREACLNALLEYVDWVHYPITLQVFISDSDSCEWEIVEGAYDEECRTLVESSSIIEMDRIAHRRLHAKERALQISELLAKFDFDARQGISLKNYYHAKGIVRSHLLRHGTLYKGKGSDVIHYSQMKKQFRLSGTTSELEFETRMSELLPDGWLACKQCNNKNSSIITSTLENNICQECFGIGGCSVGVTLDGEADDGLIGCITFDLISPEHEDAMTTSEAWRCFLIELHSFTGENSVQSGYWRSIFRSFDSKREESDISTAECTQCSSPEIEVYREYALSSTVTEHLLKLGVITSPLIKQAMGLFERNASEHAPSGDVESRRLLKLVKASYSKGRPDFFPKGDVTAAVRSGIQQLEEEFKCFTPSNDARNVIREKHAEAFVDTCEAGKFAHIENATDIDERFGPIKDFLASMAARVRGAARILSTQVPTHSLIQEFPNAHTFYGINRACNCFHEIVTEADCDKSTRSFISKNFNTLDLCTNKLSTLDLSTENQNVLGNLYTEKNVLENQNILGYQNVLGNQNVLENSSNNKNRVENINYKKREKKNV